MRAGEAEAFFERAVVWCAAVALGHTLLPAALPLDPIDAFGQAVAVHHQIVVGEGRRRRQKIGTAHRDRIEAELVRHLIEQALEGETHVDRAVAAERAAWWRVGEDALADIAD